MTVLQPSWLVLLLASANNDKHAMTIVLWQMRLRREKFKISLEYLQNLNVK